MRPSGELVDDGGHTDQRELTDRREAEELIGDLEQAVGANCDVLHEAAVGPEPADKALMQKKVEIVEGPPRWATARCRNIGTGISTIGLAGLQFCLDELTNVDGPSVGLLLHPRRVLPTRFIQVRLYDDRVSKLLVFDIAFWGKPRFAYRELS